MECLCLVGRRQAQQVQNKAAHETLLIILLQIHTGIQRGNLFGIAVERQRLAFEKLANAPLAFLRPARVINLGIDIGVKPCLLYTSDAADE